MESYREIIKDPLLKLINQRAKKARLEVYLVGGFLRDIFVSRTKEVLDLDFAVSKNSLRFAKSLAQELKFPFVLLDQEHGSCRIVAKIKGKAVNLDFTDFRGKTFEEDLLHRDFTINTLAVSLDDLEKDNLKELLIDLYGARKDLKASVIKLTHPKAFDEDPLRVLRAFSLKAALDFKIDPATLKLAQVKSRLLKNVAIERVQEELFKVFHSENAFETLEIMDQKRILTRIFPELEKLRDVDQGPYHHLDVWQHTLVAIKELENFFRNIQKAPLKNKNKLRDYLNQEIASGHKRFALIKLAALFHDIGKPKVKIVDKEGKCIFHGHESVGVKILDKILLRLKLSNQEEMTLRRMVLNHLRPGYLSDTETPTARAVFRYFRDTQEDSLGILVLSLADARATRGKLKTKNDLSQHEKVLFRLIDEYFAEKEVIKPRKILNGHDLMKALKIKPSPLVGKLLDKIQEAQAEGKVKNKQEALKFAAKNLK